MELIVDAPINPAEMSMEKIASKLYPLL